MKVFKGFLLSLIFIIYSYGADSIILAVLSSGNPVDEYRKFKALSNYLSNVLDREVQLKIVGKYTQLLDLYEEQHIDISISCPVVFYKIKEKHNVEATAVVRIDGMILEAGVIVVRKDSDIKDVNDLRDKKVTLGSSICASNCIMPLYILSKEGITYRDIPDMWSSGSDKAAILAVISGLADAAGVKEESALLFIDRIRIIAKSPYVPRLVVAVSKDIPEDLRVRIKKALYDLNDEKTLKRLGIDGFEKPEKRMFELIKDYEDILSQYPLLQ